MKAIHFFLIIVLALSGNSCKNSKFGRGLRGLPENPSESSWYINPAGFRKTIDGKKTELYRLSNKTGMEVYVTNFGAVIVAIRVPDREGKLGDVVLGFNNVEAYAAANDPYFGAVAGRYANRIDGGKFELNGRLYHLPVNETAMNNQLHGGVKGFSELIWTVEKLSGNSIELNLVSPDGDMGYPGTLTLTVSYTLKGDNSIEIEYTAHTDAPTVINVTQHSYFNLKGEGEGDILDHELMLNADFFTPVNPRLIPTGEIASVINTPMDFTSPTMIGARINEPYEQLEYAGGYDHNWVLNKAEEEPGLAATAYSPESGRFLEVLTSQPGIQFYSGNFLDGSITGKSGKKYLHRGGLCLETQHFPDSPNHPDFPSTVLNPGEQFSQKTVFRFSVK